MAESNQTLDAVLEEARRILLEANPHCSSAYLFERITKAFTVIERHIDAKRELEAA